MIPSGMAVEYAERYGLDAREVEAAIQFMPRGLPAAKAEQALDRARELAAGRPCDFRTAVQAIVQAMLSGRNP